MGGVFSRLKTEKHIYSIKLRLRDIIVKSRKSNLKSNQYIELEI